MSDKLMINRKCYRYINLFLTKIKIILKISSGNKGLRLTKAQHEYQ